MVAMTPTRCSITSAGCPLCHRGRVTSSPGCLRYSFWSYLLFLCCCWSSITTTTSTQQEQHSRRCRRRKYRLLTLECNPHYYLVQVYMYVWRVPIGVIRTSEQERVMETLSRDRERHPDDPVVYYHMLTDFGTTVVLVRLYLETSRS